MEHKLSNLIESLKSLKATIDDANINENGFKQHGWNQVHLKKEDLSFYVGNFIDKLKGYGDLRITEGLETTLENHVKNVEDLNATSKSYFNNNASHLVHIVPNILLTLHSIFSDIEYELFSYENIQDKKLLPRGLAARLRGAKARLDSINESSSTLEDKIAVINDAHDAAESLPTDLASLKEAKKQLDTLIKSAKEEFSTVTSELARIKEEAISLKSDAQKASEQAESARERASESATAASKLVDECDDALQITTTQGLAAGFDQKARELKRSMWVWIFGLLIALGTGAWIGDERVAAFAEILDSQLSAGQAILHTVMTIFSIGGPLWLAWISTQQISQRFKLSEDYYYKATVAKSFTGFKKFAERFDPSTEERLFNSTLDRLDEMPLRLIEGKNYNSPWHEFIDSEAFRNAVTMFPTLANEAGRFANIADLKMKPKQPKRADSGTNKGVTADDPNQEEA